MIVVDTSAVVAITFREPEREAMTFPRRTSRVRNPKTAGVGSGFQSLDPGEEAVDLLM